MNPVVIDSLLARQLSQAQRTLRRLYWLHGSVSVLLVSALSLLSAGAWSLGLSASPPVLWGAMFVLGLPVLLYLPVVRHSARLRNDLPALIRRLGAEPPDTLGDPLHRRLQNLIEERAIAARVAVPTAFVLDCAGQVDAFALGADRNRTVIVVTRGALVQLEREELASLIAHEMAHVVNGDTALATRLMALNRGMRRPTSIGRALCAMPAAPLPMRVFGRALIVMGAPGLAAARLVEAGLSAQRDFEADAWAVEQTGQRLSLTRTLLKVSQASSEHAGPWQGVCASTITCAGYADWHELGLVRFAAPRAWARGAASNPAVTQRLHRLCADQGVPLERDGVDMHAVTEPALPSLDMAGDPSEPVRARPRRVLLQDDEPQWWDHDEQLEGARAPTAVMRLMRATREPAGAAALAVALVTSPDDGKGPVADEAESQQPDWGTAWLVAAQRYAGLRETLAELPAESLQALRWPLLELAAGRLRPLALPARQALIELARRHSDEDRAESASRHWIHFVLLQRRLGLGATGLKGPAEAPDARSVRVLFALVARDAQLSEPRADRAANAAIRALGLPPIGGSAGVLTLRALERAAEHAASLPAMARVVLIDHLHQLMSDQPVASSAEFLRLLSLAIDCPQPGERLAAREDSAEPWSATHP